MMLLSLVIYQTPDFIKDKDALKKEHIILMLHFDTLGL